MTISEIIDRYGIFLMPDGRIGIHFLESGDKMFDYIKEHKQEIVDYIKAEKEREKREYEERERKIASIEGLKEIKAAIADLQDWQDEFDRSFDDVGGLGVRKKPEYDLKAMKARFPRAAAYLEAESFDFSSNYNKSKAGRKAKERILNGEDYVSAIADMKNEWDAYIKERMFD